MLVTLLLLTILSQVGGEMQRARTTANGCTYEYFDKCNVDIIRNRCYRKLYWNSRGSIDWSNWGKDMSEIIDACCDHLPKDNYCFGAQFYGECWTDTDCTRFKRWPCNRASKKWTWRDTGSDATDKIGGPFANAYYCAFKCGYRSPSPRLKRIVGGSVEDSWPWVGALFDTSISTESVYHARFCSATLISCKWVMTSAFCIDNHQKTLSSTNSKISEGKIKVLFGKTNLNVSASGGLRFKKAYIPPQRKPKYPFTWDIALLELEDPVNLSQDVHPICLDDADVELDPNNSYRVVGWGSTDRAVPSGTGPVNLLGTHTNEVSCPSPGTEYQMCFDSLERKGTCAGDYGGPYMRELNGRWYQSAIINWSWTKMVSRRPRIYECAHPGYTEFATKISNSEIRKWINDMTGL